MFDFSAERTLQSVDESLARLGVEYVDIIQVTFSLLPMLYHCIHFRLIDITQTFIGVLKSIESASNLVLTHSYSGCLLSN